MAERSASPRRITDTEAWCAPCGQMHPRSAFGLRSTATGGLNYACRAVVAARNAANHQRHRDRNIQRHRDLRAARMAGPDRLNWALKKLVSEAARRAKAKGIEFSLTVEALGRPPTHCPVFGTELVYQARGGRLDNSASLDRIDTRHGYTPGNVWLISWRANQLKNEASLTELQQLVRALEKKLAP